MKFSATLRRLLAFASLALVTAASLFGAQPAAATPHTATTTPTDATTSPASATPLTDEFLSKPNAPHFFVLKIAPGKMEDALKIMQQRIKDTAVPSVVGVDGAYLILVQVQDKDRDIIEKLLSPCLDNGPIPTSFTLEVRHGNIIEDGKEINNATVGNVVDYVQKKYPEFSILYSGVADMPVGDLYLHMPDFLPNSVCHAIAKSTDGLVFDDGVDSGGVRSLTLAPTESLDRDVEVFNLTVYVNPNGNLDSKTVHEKFESVVEIILETLHDLDPNASNNAAPRFQFHEGANLLVATGSREALQVTTKVVTALTDRNNQPVKAEDSDPFGYYTTPANSNAPQTAEVDKLKAEIYDIQKSMEIENSTVKLQADQQRLLEAQKKLNDLIQQMQSLPHAIQNTTPAVAPAQPAPGDIPMEGRLFQNTTPGATGGGSSSSPGVNPSPGQSNK
jgi:hypothetical protein